MAEFQTYAENKRQEKEKQRLKETLAPLISTLEEELEIQVDQEFSSRNEFEKFRDKCYAERDEQNNQNDLEAKVQAYMDEVVADVRAEYDVFVQDLADEVIRPQDARRFFDQHRRKIKDCISMHFEVDTKYSRKYGFHICRYPAKSASTSHLSELVSKVCTKVTDHSCNRYESTAAKTLLAELELDFINMMPRRGRYGNHGPTTPLLDDNQPIESVSQLKQRMFEETGIKFPSNWKTASHSKIEEWYKKAIPYDEKMERVRADLKEMFDFIPKSRLDLDKILNGVGKDYGTRDIERYRDHCFNKIIKEGGFDVRNTFMAHYGFPYSSPGGPEIDWETMEVWYHEENRFRAGRYALKHTAMKEAIMLGDRVLQQISNRYPNRFFHQTPEDCLEDFSRSLKRMLKPDSRAKPVSDEVRQNVEALSTEASDFRKKDITVVDAVRFIIETESL